MKIGFIGLGNMAGTICQGLIKSDFIDGSERIQLVTLFN